MSGFTIQICSIRVRDDDEPDRLPLLRVLDEADNHESVFRRYRRRDLLLTVGVRTTEAFLVVTGKLAVMVPTKEAEIRLELVTSGQLLVLQEMLAGGSSPVRVVADEDTDVLAIRAQALVDAMERNRVVARDISAVAEARRQAIIPLDRGLRIVA